MGDSRTAAVLETSGPGQDSGRSSGTFGPFRFDAANRLLFRAGTEVPLPPRVMGILAHLLEQPGQVVSRQDLLDSVWKDAFVSDTSLAEAISFLRQALGDDPQRPTYVQTVHRRGYRFVAALAPHEPQASKQAAVAPEPATASLPAVGLNPGHEAASPWAPVLPWGLAASLAFIAGALLFGVARIEPFAQRPLVRFTIALPSGSRLDTRTSLALSRDGSQLAFVACDSARCRLFLRRMDQVEPLEISGTDGARSPFFSPDGSGLAFSPAAS